MLWLSLEVCMAGELQLTGARVQPQIAHGSSTHLLRVKVVPAAVVNYGGDARPNLCESVLRIADAY